MAMLSVCMHLWVPTQLCGQGCRCCRRRFRQRAPPSTCEHAGERLDLLNCCLIPGRPDKLGWPVFARNQHHIDSRGALRPTASRSIQRDQDPLVTLGPRLKAALWLTMNARPCGPHTLSRCQKKRSCITCTILSMPRSAPAPVRLTARRCEAAAAAAAAGGTALWYISCLRITDSLLQNVFNLDLEYSDDDALLDWEQYAGERVPPAQPKTCMRSVIPFESTPGLCP